MPRVARNAVNKALETAEQEIGQDNPRRLSSTGPAVLEAAQVEVVDRPVDKEWADMMAFARQKVKIVINPSTDKNAEDPVYIGNQGDSMWLKRNEEHVIERRFVESLARAKITSYTQREEQDPSGIRHVINVPHTACRYPFRVVEDPHPRGGDWLRAVLLEA